MEQTKLNRRTFVKGAAAMGALAAMASLAGCNNSGDTEEPAEDAASTEDEGTEDSGSTEAASRIVLGRPTDSDNLDPVTCIGNQNIFMFNLIVEGLVKTHDTDTEIEPCLAESWDVSDDGLTYTFHVMEGLKFSDGSDVTAEDWQWTFDRAMAATDSNWYSCVENIESVECPDDTTVIITMKQAAASTLANLSIFEVAVQSKAHFDEVGEAEYVNAGPVGTGAYRLKEWRKGEYMIFEANPYYRVEGLPPTQEVEFRVVADDNSRVIQLQGGDIDIADTVPFSSMQQLEGDANCEPHPDPATMVYWISLNVQNEYLSNQAVREALFLATDAQEIVDTVSFGYAETAGSIMSATSIYCDTTLEPPVADVDAAKAKLEEAGYPDGFELRLLMRGGNATYESIGTVLAAQWAKIGVTVNIDSREATAYSAARKELDLDIVISGWSDDVPDPTSLMQFCFDYSVNGGYYSGFEQPEEMQELNNQATVELDVEKRKELYAEIQQTFREQAIYIPVMTVPWQNCLRKDVTGFVQTPMGNYRFENIAKEA